MVKRLELDIKCCYDCPYLALDSDDFFEYLCKHEYGPDYISDEDAEKNVHKDCPLKDKEN